MEPDGLAPSGTFIEFSWHSFETDGYLDGMSDGDWATPSSAWPDGAQSSLNDGDDDPLDVKVK